MLPTSRAGNKINAQVEHGTADKEQDNSIGKETEAEKASDGPSTPSFAQRLEGIENGVSRIEQWFQKPDAKSEVMLQRGVGFAAMFAALAVALIQPSDVPTVNLSMLSIVLYIAGALLVWIGPVPMRMGASPRRTNAGARIMLAGVLGLVLAFIIDSSFDSTSVSNVMWGLVSFCTILVLVGLVLYRFLGQRSNN